MNKKAILLFLGLLVSLAILSGCSASNTKSELSLEEMSLDDILPITTAIGLGSKEVSDPYLVRLLTGLLADIKLAGQEPNSDYNNKRITINVNGGKVTYQLKTHSLYTDVPALLNIKNEWYHVPPEFTNLFTRLDEYPDYNTEVFEEDRLFLSDFGLTPAFLINQMDMLLPSTLKHQAGDFPSTIYWAYNNELNKETGLDITSALGSEVDVRVYKILELMPNFMQPRRGAGRVVIVRNNGQLVGSWIDAGRHYGFACSLNRKPFTEVTGLAWGEWIQEHIDIDDPLERELSLLSPEQIISTYYEAIDSQDYRWAYACISRQNLTTYLFRNMDNHFLYNPDYETVFDDGLGNIKSVQLKNIERKEQFENDEDVRIYAVTVDIDFNQPITHESGEQHYLIKIIRETPNSGWRIESEGTISP